MQLLITLTFVTLIGWMVAETGGPIELGPAGPGEQVEGPGGPEGPVREPERPVQGPEGPVEEPEGPVQGPKVSVKGPQGPEGPFEGPKGPEGPVEGPEGPVEGPEGPEGPAEEPETQVNEEDFQTESEMYSPPAAESTEFYVNPKPADIAIECVPLRSKRYITDGFCTSIKPVEDVVCTGNCLPIADLPWYAEYIKVWSRTKILEYRCVDDLVRQRKVTFNCDNGETRSYVIPVVRSCKCKKYERNQNKSLNKKLLKERTRKTAYKS